MSSKEIISPKTSKDTFVVPDLLYFQNLVNIRVKLKAVQFHPDSGTLLLHNKPDLA